MKAWAQGAGVALVYAELAAHHEFITFFAANALSRAATPSAVVMNSSVSNNAMNSETTPPYANRAWLRAAS